MNPRNPENRVSAIEISDEIVAKLDHKAIFRTENRPSILTRIVECTKLKPQVGADDIATVNFTVPRQYAVRLDELKRNKNEPRWQVISRLLYLLAQSDNKHAEAPAKASFDDITTIFVPPQMLYQLDAQAMYPAEAYWRITHRLLAVASEIYGRLPPKTSGKHRIIKVKFDVLDKIKALRAYSCESYADIITRLIDADTTPHKEIPKNQKKKPR